MALLRKYAKASSLLESVIALAIISACFFIAVVIFATVFTPRTSSHFYLQANKAETIFYMMQVDRDSATEDENISVKEEWLGTDLKKVSLKTKDSMQYERTFYIRTP